MLSYSCFHGNYLSFEMASFVVSPLLKVMAIMGRAIQIKTDNALAYVSSKMKQFFACYNIKHVTGIPHNTTGHAVIERANLTFKEMLIKQKGRVKNPRDRLNNALLTLNFLNVGEKEQ